MDLDFDSSASQARDASPFPTLRGGSEGVNRTSDPVHPWLKHTRVGDTDESGALKKSNDPALCYPKLSKSRSGPLGLVSAASAGGCDGAIDVDMLIRACIDVVDTVACDSDTYVDTRIDDTRNTSIDIPSHIPHTTHTPPPSRPTFSSVVSTASIPSCKLTPIARSSPDPVVKPTRPAAANSINTNIGILKEGEGNIETSGGTGTSGDGGVVVSVRKEIEKIENRRGRSPTVKRATRNDMSVEADQPSRKRADIFSWSYLSELRSHDKPTVESPSSCDLDAKGDRPSLAMLAAIIVSCS